MCAMPFSIELLTAADFDAWAALRLQLWPEQSVDELRHDGEALLARGDGAVAFVAKSDGSVVGFAEATLRVDFVNGTSTSPVAFLEGLYVVPQWRRQGAARALCDAIERWGAGRGCTEFASDALLENEQGHNVHVALGFAETERVVYFLKPIVRDAT
jgi:aminoglycoside 6'-N-acetyltransferase I